MSNQTLLFVLGGCLLGIVQLLAGIAIGVWLRRCDSAAARRERQEMMRANEIAKRLQELADEMSLSVGEHRSQLEQASQLLRSDASQDDQAVASLVVDVIGEIVRANQNLQSKLETAESRLVEQAVEIEAHISRSLTDTLTGLPNRRQFNERLEERMADWNRHGEPFSLLMVDVDHFKQLNDEHGHLAGDAVLVAVGRGLRGAVRREDLVARYGGEEFAILLPKTSLAQAVQVAENVRKSLASLAIMHSGAHLAVTISGGVATIRNGEREEALIQRADAALYAAKAAGRNCTFVHDGTTCRPIHAAAARSGPSTSLIELLESPDTEVPAGRASPEPAADEFGSSFERESISSQLAQACAELRKFMQERVHRDQDAAASPDR